MRIIHISTHDRTGGAALAANRLHRAILRQGQDSVMCVFHQARYDPSVIKFVSKFGKEKLGIRKRAIRYLNNHLDLIRPIFGLKTTKSPGLLDYGYYFDSKPEGYELFSDGKSAIGMELMKQLPYSDVVNLHWVSHFLDFNSFFERISSYTKIVWTMHDMNAFTGGCHYDMGCSRYLQNCGKCPQLGSNIENDLSRHVLQYKRKLFNKLDREQLTFVSPSHWLKEAASNSIIARFPIKTIPNGLDIDEFAPRDRSVVRQVFGIPQKAGVVLFLAESVNNHRKGMQVLIKALHGIKKYDDIFLLAVGDNKSPLDLNFNHLLIEPISNDRLLSLIYSAADVFVIPSLQDNFPNTIIESLACGTPVIGSNVGGIEEAIKDGVNGFLFPKENIQTLRNLISEIFANKEKLENLRKNCRDIAIENYKSELQAKRYIALYKDMLN